MAAFEYLVLDQNGHQKKGVIEGDTPKQVRQKLRELHFIPLEVKSIDKQTSKKSFSWFSNRSLSHIDRALFTRQLATLLNAGLPIEEALQALIEQSEKPHVKKIIAAIHAKVLEGHSFANALSSFPQAFSPLYCATVSAGEQTGHLDQVLLRLADYIEQQLMVKQKIQQGMIYPTVMLFIAFLIVSFLMVYVVPRIVGIFSDMGQDLPILTKALLKISAFLSHHGVVLIVVIIAMTWFIKRILKYEQYRFVYQQFLLRIPFLNRMIKIINTAQFAHTFSILTNAGVTVLDALRISAEVVMCLPIRQKILIATDHVKEGTPLHYALQQTSYFTPMSIHLISSGEASGQLDAMLEKMATYQDQEVLRIIEVALTLFEPLLIVVMGGVVLFIVLAILLPIFSINQIVV